MLLELAPLVTPPIRDRSFVGAGLTPSLDLDTSSVPREAQSDFFRSWYSGLAEVSAFRNTTASFPARQMAWSFGRLTLTYLSAPEVSFTWKNLKMPTIDSWCLHLALPRAPNQEEIATNRLRIFSLGDLFRGFSENCDHLTLCIPRNLNIVKSSQIAVRDDAKQFLTDYLLLLFRSLPTLRRTDVAQVDAATTNLLAACLVPIPDHATETRKPTDLITLSLALQLIEEQLANTGLTPRLVCRQLGVSRSRLYRIFEPLGGISGYIRRERLRKTREALQTGSDVRPIFAIAEQWGFWDPSAYSRMFKKEFGISPSEARAGHVKDVPSARSVDTITLRDLLFSNY